jgi:hypothetical protein
MSTGPRNRIVRAATDAMWERDKLQMRIIDRLLTPRTPARAVRKRVRRARRVARRVTGTRR